MLLLSVEEAADSVEGAGFAEDYKAFEEWGGLRAAGEDGAEEHEVFFDAPLFCGAGFADCGIEGVVSPVGGFERGEEVGGEGEGFFEGALFGEEDFFRWVDGIAKEEACGVADFGEGFDAGLDEGCDFAEVAVAEDGLAEGEKEVFGG